MNDEEEKQDAEYGLIMPFKDQSPSFALGFECGQIYKLLEANKPFETCFNADNRDQVEMMCKRFLVTYSITGWVDGWLKLVAIPKPGAHN